MRGQQVLATEIDDGLMLSFALVIAISLNDAHVFVFDPGLAAWGSDYAQEHRRRPPNCTCDYFQTMPDSQGKMLGN